MGAAPPLNADNGRLYQRELSANLRLQRSLLPAPSARAAAADAEGVYLPPSGAGAPGGRGSTPCGDWWDVIPLPGGRVAFVVGDVVGHGLRASAVMARMRTAVRVLADIELPPDELLTHLDDLVQRLDEDPDSAREKPRGQPASTPCTTRWPAASRWPPPGIPGEPRRLDRSIRGSACTARRRDHQVTPRLRKIPRERGELVRRRSGAGGCVGGGCRWSWDDAAAGPAVVPRQLVPPGRLFPPHNAQ